MSHCLKGQAPKQHGKKYKNTKSIKPGASFSQVINNYSHKTVTTINMANPYFQFKSFTVYHDRSTLKVSTDSCLFGAWLAALISKHPLGIHKALDIGSGTGLLMLMLAQKFEGTIHGIEIDQDSFEQATENIKASPWYDRMKLFHSDVKLFESPHQYDLIFTNPPFYEGDLKADSLQKNLARHDDGLTLSDLLEVVNRNLTQQGKFAVLLPWHRVEAFISLASNYELFVQEKLRIQQTPQHPFFRAAMLLGRNNSGIPHSQTIIIQQSPDKYSERFTELLKDYYLYL